MDWFLYDNGLRHERIKAATYLKGLHPLISFLNIFYEDHFQPNSWNEPFIGNLKDFTENSQENVWNFTKKG